MTTFYTNKCVQKTTSLNYAEQMGDYFLLIREIKRRTYCAIARIKIIVVMAHNGFENPFSNYIYLYYMFVNVYTKSNVPCIFCRFWAVYIPCIWQTHCMRGTKQDILCLLRIGKNVTGAKKGFKNMCMLWGGTCTFRIFFAYPFYV